MIRCFCIKRGREWCDVFAVWLSSWWENFALQGAADVFLTVYCTDGVEDVVDIVESVCGDAGRMYIKVTHLTGYDWVGYIERVRSGKERYCIDKGSIDGALMRLMGFEEEYRKCAECWCDEEYYLRRDVIIHIDLDTLFIRRSDIWGWIKDFAECRKGYSDYDVFGVSEGKESREYLMDGITDSEYESRLSEYINCGFIGIRASECRGGMVERFKAWFETASHCKCLEQDWINEEFAGRKMVCDNRYNFNFNHHRLAVAKGLRVNPMMVHFYGANKPWLKRGTDGDGNSEVTEYHALTEAFFDEYLIWLERVRYVVDWNFYRKVRRGLEGSYSERRKRIDEFYAAQPKPREWE